MSNGRIEARAEKGRMSDSEYEGFAGQSAVERSETSTIAASRWPRNRSAVERPQAGTRRAGEVMDRTAIRPMHDRWRV